MWGTFQGTNSPYPTFGNCKSSSTRQCLLGKGEGYVSSQEGNSFSTCKFSGQFLGGSQFPTSISLDANQVTTELWLIIWKGCQKTQQWNFKPKKNNLKKSVSGMFNLENKKSEEKKQRDKTSCFIICSTCFLMSQLAQSHLPKKKAYLGISYE